ncbi:MAG: hypothetical protein EOP09_01870 [Proteobacteria bacterium]|nr:MAG: hypothetical protein EOP09_01870 [Pseudomonadota bacterium]
MTSQVELFNRVLADTKKRLMRWKYARLGEYESFVFQPKTVFRAFKSELELPGGNFRVFLVEKKFPDAEWDFEIEKYRPELHFLEGQNNVLEITDDDVDISSFGTLITEVAFSTDTARRLLGL